MVLLDPSQEYNFVQAHPRKSAIQTSKLGVQSRESSLINRHMISSANQPTDRAWARNLRSGWARSRADNFTRVLSGLPTEFDLVDDALTQSLGSLAAAVVANGGKRTEEVQKLDYEIMGRIRERVESLVKTETTAAALKPYYHLNCKR